MIRITNDWEIEELSESIRIEAMPSALRQSGLAEHDFSSETVRLRELPGRSFARFRLGPDPGEAPPGFPAATGQCMGADPAVLCLRPGEWLWTSGTDSPRKLLERAAAAVDPERGAVYDASDGLAVFRLSGVGAAWLLSKLSGLDFLAGAGGDEHCARTRMGRIAVVVHHHLSGEGSSQFDLVVDRSYARYLWELLKASAPHADDLARSFGVRA